MPVTLLTSTKYVLPSPLTHCLRATSAGMMKDANIATSRARARSGRRPRYCSSTENMSTPATTLVVASTDPATANDVGRLNTHAPANDHSAHVGGDTLIQYPERRCARSQSAAHKVKTPPITMPGSTPVVPPSGEREVERVEAGAHDDQRHEEHLEARHRQHREREAERNGDDEREHGLAAREQGNLADAGDEPDRRQKPPPAPQCLRWDACQLLADR